MPMNLFDVETRAGLVKRSNAYKVALVAKMMIYSLLN